MVSQPEPEVKEPVTLANLARDLEAGALTARTLVERALERAAGPGHQGDAAFVSIDAQRIRAEADGVDAARKAGRAPGPYAGIPVSIKDLFDVEGEVTTAGSTILAGNPPAKSDAAAVARLRKAGFIPFGRANMTEFAFSGLGMNAHYGDPASPYDRETGHVAGGSSSGGAVSVAEGIVPLTLGTDTGGSCRIPAACCGITGYKPTASRVPQAGTYPLSKSLDSIGPLGNTVACCAAAFAVLAAEPDCALQAKPARSLKFAVLKNYVQNDMDDTVAADWQRALSALSAAGAQLTEVTFAPLDEMKDINARGGLVTAEALRLHRDMLKDKETQYDPRVSRRIRRAEAQGEGEYEAILSARAAMIAAAREAFAPFDAVVMPTLPIIPPRFEDVATEEGYTRNNLLLLRNPSTGNWLDRCAITLPMHSPGTAPTGFMLMGENGGDEALFSAAAGVETVLRDARG